MQQIEWQVAEWDDEKENQSAYLDGIEGEYGPAMRQEDKWAWMVRPSGSRSEYPEVYTNGTEDTEEEARKAAEAAMREADKSYGHPFENV